MSPDDVAALVGTGWGLAVADVAALDGGMNAATWRVATSAGAHVLKRVGSADAAWFEGGLRCAAVVEAAGVPAGRPRPTPDGALTVIAGDGRAALLSWAGGEPLDGRAGAQRVAGDALGRAHLALLADPPPRLLSWHWVDPAAEHLDVEPWIRPAVARAVRGLDLIGCGATADGRGDGGAGWGPLHGDPFPGAFLHDATTGACGITDWALGVRGPLLYDVASAVMYLGGPDAAVPFLATYVTRRPDAAAGIGKGIATMLRFRWAVQADYFAARVAAGDLTGIEGPDGNVLGLHDARDFFTREGSR